MTVESFMYPKCGKFTRHIDIGMQGGLNAENRQDKTNNLDRKLFANVFGGVADHTGLTKIGSILSGKGTIMFYDGRKVHFMSNMCRCD